MDPGNGKNNGPQIKTEADMDQANNATSITKRTRQMAGADEVYTGANDEVNTEIKTEDITNDQNQMNGVNEAESTADSNADAVGELAVWQVSHNPGKRRDFIIEQRKRTIQMLSGHVKKNGKARNYSSQEYLSLVERTKMFLTWLELDVQMTPHLKAQTRIDMGLNLMFSDTRFEFPKEIQDHASTLFERWEGENWGQNEVEDENGADESDDDGGDQRDDDPPQAKRRKSNASKPEENGKLNTIRLPPRDHPIWGVDGIIHGLALQKGQRRQYVLDPRYARSKRNPKVFGNNGFENGDWFPFQSVALFRGCHGAPMAGIAGNREDGAWSVVTSGTYQDLDKDLGDVLYYSGSGSHENVDPKTPAASTSGTMALHASLASGRPVRVLRAAKKTSKYAPIVGIRYDGLYTIVDVRYPKNSKGGMYEQFKLQRNEGQSEIAAKTRPTAREVRDYDQISRLF